MIDNRSIGNLDNLYIIHAFVTIMGGSEKGIDGDNKGLIGLIFDI